MDTTIRRMWRAVRPTTAQQRFLWRCGALLVLSGAVHAAVAAVDAGPWAGAVSWRKPVLFGLSFGMLLCSLGWVLRQLPDRRWGWLPTGVVAGTAVLEVALVTLQRWRGVPSHFNAATPGDAAVWSAMGLAVMALVLGLLALLGRAVFRFRGSPPARVAVLAGLLLVLAGGAIGNSMAATGEAVVDATGRVPEELFFGAAGSAKLAHALGIHGLQVMGLLAVALEIGRLPARARWVTMLAGAAGYAALFAAVTVTAYAGRPWTSPGPAMGLLALAGLLSLLAAAGVVVRHLPSDPPEDRPRDSRDEAGSPPAAVVS